MTKTRSFFAAIYIIIGCIACDQSVKIPSYIYIDKFSFSAKPGEGTTNQNLTDAWIYINHNYYGAYELPTKIPIPVLEEGESSLLIYPGYRQDGMITNSFIYALLNSYSNTITLIPGQIDTIRPATSYQDGLSFSIVDFDGRHFFNKDRDNDVDTYIKLSSAAEAFEGSNSGLIELTSTNPHIYTEDDLNNLVIPQSVDPIILELNYKSDIPFRIGFIGKIPFTEDDILLNAVILPKQEWTKIYFDFRTILNLSNSEYYHLAIEANYDPSFPLATQRILLDNIKIIHR